MSRIALFLAFGLAFLWVLAPSPAPADDGCEHCSIDVAAHLDTVRGIVDRKIEAIQATLSIGKSSSPQERQEMQETLAVLTFIRRQLERGTPPEWLVCSIYHQGLTATIEKVKELFAQLATEAKDYFRRVDEARELIASKDKLIVKLQDKIDELRFGDSEEIRRLRFEVLMANLQLVLLKEARTYYHHPMHGQDNLDALIDQTKEELDKARAALEAHQQAQDAMIPELQKQIDLLILEKESLFAVFREKPEALRELECKLGVTVENPSTVTVGPTRFGIHPKTGLPHLQSWEDPQVQAHKQAQEARRAAEEARFNKWIEEFGPMPDLTGGTGDGSTDGTVVETVPVVPQEKEGAETGTVEILPTGP